MLSILSDDVLPSFSSYVIIIEQRELKKINKTIYSPSVLSESFVSINKFFFFFFQRPAWNDAKRRRRGGRHSSHESEILHALFHVVVQPIVAREARGGIAAVAAAPGRGEHAPTERPRRHRRRKVYGTHNVT